MPAGHRHCARNKSLPMDWRSAVGNSSSHPRTGSLPEALRKKTRGSSEAPDRPATVYRIQLYF